MSQRDVVTAETAGSAAKSLPAEQLSPEPMDRQITSIQPGGGMVMRLELAWGSVRRWYLKAFRPGYVARMRELRRGEPSGCPHEVLDPRDLKYYRNVCGCYWDPADDPFAWRDRLPFAREGLAELVWLSALCFGTAAAVIVLVRNLVWSGPAVWAGYAVAAFLALVGLEVVWFFRDPRRKIPDGPGLIVAPADGRIAEIVELEWDEFLQGPAVRIGIFLSIFNVHANRSPADVRVIGLRYRKGKFLNALRPESARENEQLELRLQETEPPYRRFVVRQIAGAIARRIVCTARPGQQLARGERFGMIKLGSRTELVLPKESALVVHVREGQAVHAGSTVLAEYRPAGVDDRDPTAVGAHAASGVQREQGDRKTDSP